MAKSRISLKSIVAAFAAFILVIFSGTPIYVSFFALFLGPVSKDLGWNLATFPQGMLAYSISFAIAAPFGGALSDRLGVRVAVLSGIALTTCGLLGLSTMSGALLPLIGFSCLVGVGGAMVGVTSLASIVAGHFEKGRGLVMGLVFGAGPMLAAGAFSPVISAAIAGFGWRTAYQGLAGASAAASLLMILALPKPPAAAAPAPGLSAARAGAGEDLRLAIRQRSFWLILAASAILPIVFGGVSGHLVAITTEKGWPSSFGAEALSAAFLAGMVGPVMAGAAIDWLDRPQTLLPFIAAPVLGLGILLFKVPQPLLICASALIGLGFSAWSGQTALLITRYFGLRVTGAVVGIAFSIGGVMLGCGPVILGILRTGSGDYRSGLLACIGLQVLAIVVVALFAPFPSRRTEQPTPDVTPAAGAALGGA